MNKANDWLAVSLKSPDTSLGDLYNQGVTPANTTIRDKSTYLSSDVIKKQFTNPESGQFDQKAFDKYYDANVAAFNEFQKHAPTNIFDGSDDWTASPYSKGRESKNPVKLSTISGNPFKNLKTAQGSVFGGSRFGQWSAPTKSEAEIAQDLKVLDHKTGKELDFTPNDVSLMDGFGFFKSPLVRAQYDEEVKDKNGEVIHNIGDLKYDENGLPRYETLGDRDPARYQVLSRWDTLTRDNSFMNKLDPFDSDGLDKSIGSIVMKNALAIAPAFIPYVGPAYVGAYVAKNLAGAAIETYQSFLGITSNKRNGALNTLAGALKQTEQGLSEKGRDGFFNVESLASMISDSVFQLKGQRWIAEVPLQIAAARYQKGLGVSREVLENIGKAKGLTGKALDSYIKNIAIAKNLDSYEKIAKTANWAGTAYMAATSATEISENSRRLGLDQRDAGLLYIGLTAALAPLFRADVGQIATKGIGLDEIDRAMRKVIRGEFQKGGSMFEAAEAAAKAGAKESAGSASAAGTSAILEDTSKGWLHKGFLMGKKAKDAIFNRASKFDAMAEKGGVAGEIGVDLLEGAYGEGIEEITEFALQKGLEGIYNGLNSLGYTSTEQGVQFSFDPKKLGEELLATAVGGALGGAVFRGINRMEGNNFKQDWTLVDAINAGYSDKLIKAVDDYKDKGILPGSADLSFSLYEDADGKSAPNVFKPVSDGAVSQQQFIADKVKDTINHIKHILDSEGILQHQGVIQDKNELINNITNLGIDSDIYDSLRAATTDVINARLALEKFTDSELDSDAAKKAAKTLKEAKAEYERLTSPESTDEFLRQALFNMNGKATGYMASIQLDNITKKLAPEFDTYISLQIAAEANPSLKDKISQVDAEFNDYKKTDKYKNELRDMRRSLEEFTVQTPEGKKALKEYAEAIKAFAEESVLVATKSANENLQLVGADANAVDMTRQELISRQAENLAKMVGVKVGSENFLRVAPNLTKIVEISQKLGYVPSMLINKIRDEVSTFSKMINEVTNLDTGVLNEFEGMRSANKEAAASYGHKKIIGGTRTAVMLADLTKTPESSAAFFTILKRLNDGDETALADLQTMYEGAGYVDVVGAAYGLIEEIDAKKFVQMFIDGGTDFDEAITSGKFAYLPKLVTTEEDPDTFELFFTAETIKENEGALGVSSDLIHQLASISGDLKFSETSQAIVDVDAVLKGLPSSTSPFDSLIQDVRQYIDAQENTIRVEGAENYANTSKDFSENIDSNMSKVRNLLGAIVAMGEINPIINAFREANPESTPRELRGVRYLTFGDTEEDVVAGYGSMFTDVKDLLGRLQYLKDLNTFNINNTTKKLKKESGLYNKLHAKELINVVDKLPALLSLVPDEFKAHVQAFQNEVDPLLEELNKAKDLDINELTDDINVEHFKLITSVESLFFKHIGTNFLDATEEVQKEIYKLLMPESAENKTAFAKNSLEDEEFTTNNRAWYIFRLLTTDPVKLFKVINGTPNNVDNLTTEEILPFLYESPFAPYQSQTEAVITGFIAMNTKRSVWNLLGDNMYKSNPGGVKLTTKTLAITAPAGSGKTSAVLGKIIKFTTAKGHKVLAMAPESTQAKVLNYNLIDELGIDPENLAGGEVSTVKEVLAQILPDFETRVMNFKFKDAAGKELSGKELSFFIVNSFNEAHKQLNALVDEIFDLKKEELKSMLDGVRLIVIDEATHVLAPITYVFNALVARVNGGITTILSGDELQMGASLENTQYNIDRFLIPRATRLTTSVRSKWDLVADTLAEVQMHSEKLALAPDQEIKNYKIGSINLTHDPEALVGFKQTDLVTTDEALLNELAPIFKKLEENPEATLLYVAQNSTEKDKISALLQKTKPELKEQIKVSTPEVDLYTSATVVTPKSAQSMQATYVVIDAIPEDVSGVYGVKRTMEFYNTMLTRVKNFGLLVNRGTHTINFLNSIPRNASEVLKFTPESINAFKELEIRRMMEVVNVNTETIKKAPAKSAPTQQEELQKRLDALVSIFDDFNKSPLFSTAVKAEDRAKEIKDYIDGVKDADTFEETAKIRELIIEIDKAVKEFRKKATATKPPTPVEFDDLTEVNKVNSELSTYKSVDIKVDTPVIDVTADLLVAARALKRADGSDAYNKAVEDLITAAEEEYNNALNIFHKLDNYWDNFAGKDFNDITTEDEATNIKELINYLEGIKTYLYDEDIQRLAELKQLLDEWNDREPDIVVKSVSDILRSASVTKGTPVNLKHSDSRINFYEVTDAMVTRSLKDFPLEGKTHDQAFNIIRSQFLGIPVNAPILSADSLNSATISIVQAPTVDKTASHVVVAKFTHNGKEFLISLGAVTLPLYGSSAIKPVEGIPFNEFKKLIGTTPQNLTIGNKVSYSLADISGALYSNAYTVENQVLTLNANQWASLPDEAKAFLESSGSVQSMRNGDMFSFMIYNNQIAEAHQKGELTADDLFIMWVNLMQNSNVRGSGSQEYNTAEINIKGKTYKVREFDIQPIIAQAQKITVMDFIKAFKGVSAKGQSNFDYIFGKNAEQNNTITPRVAIYLAEVISAAINYIKSTGTESELLTREYPEIKMSDGSIFMGGNIIDQLEKAAQGIIRRKSLANVARSMALKEFFKSNDTAKAIEDILNAVQSTPLKDSDGNELAKASGIFVGIPFVAYRKGQQADVVNMADIITMEKFERVLGKPMAEVSFGAYSRPGLSLVLDGGNIREELQKFATPEPPKPPATKIVDLAKVTAEVSAKAKTKVPVMFKGATNKITEDKIDNYVNAVKAKESEILKDIAAIPNEVVRQYFESNPLEISVYIDESGNIAATRFSPIALLDAITERLTAESVVDMTPELLNWLIAEVDNLGLHLSAPHNLYLYNNPDGSVYLGIIPPTKGPEPLANIEHLTPEMAELFIKMQANPRVSNLSIFDKQGNGFGMLDGNFKLILSGVMQPQTLPVVMVEAIKSIKEPNLKLIAFNLLTAESSKLIMAVNNIPADAYNSEEFVTFVDNFTDFANSNCL